jgi:hypothetical protein
MHRTEDALAVPAGAFNVLSTSHNDSTVSFLVRMVVPALARCAYPIESVVEQSLTKPLALCPACRMAFGCGFWVRSLVRH